MTGLGLDNTIYIWLNAMQIIIKLCKHNFFIIIICMPLSAYTSCYGCQKWTEASLLLTSYNKYICPQWSLMTNIEIVQFSKLNQNETHEQLVYCNSLLFWNTYMTAYYFNWFVCYTVNLIWSNCMYVGCKCVVTAKAQLQNLERMSTLKKLLA